MLSLSLSLSLSIYIQSPVDNSSYGRGIKEGHGSTQNVQQHGGVHLARSPDHPRVVQQRVAQNEGGCEEVSETAINHEYIEVSENSYQS